MTFYNLNSIKMMRFKTSKIKLLYNNNNNWSNIKFINKKIRFNIRRSSKIIIKINTLQKRNKIYKI